MLTKTIDPAERFKALVKKHESLKTTANSGIEKYSLVGSFEKIREVIEEIYSMMSSSSFSLKITSIADSLKKFLLKSNSYNLTISRYYTIESIGIELTFSSKKFKNKLIFTVSDWPNYHFRYTPNIKKEFQREIILSGEDTLQIFSGILSIICDPSVKLPLDLKKTLENLILLCAKEWCLQ